MSIVRWRTRRFRDLCNISMPCMFHALDCGKAHAWPRYCFADRFGVRRISLASFDVSLHVSWWHQLDRMAKLPQFPSPMMCDRTSLDFDQARTKAREELQRLTAAQRLADDNLAVGINTVNLQNVLGEVEADCRNLVHGVVPFDLRHSCHPDIPRAEVAPPHQIMCAANALKSLKSYSNI